MVEKKIDRRVDCKACPLRKGARRVVMGEGNLDADVMIVGEGPGDVEDRQVRPFVGPAGEILRKKLTELGVLDQVYITNVTKCKPPLGMKPKVGDVAACAKWLEIEINTVQPSIIVTLGATATKTFIKKSVKMYEANGQVFDWHTYRVVPVVHPAAQLHYQKSKKAKQGTEPDASGEKPKQPEDYFFEGMDKVFGGEIDQGRQHALSDFY